jgi:hypothetical protein
MAPGANHVAGAPARAYSKGTDNKADTYRRISALKDCVTAASILGFGAITGLVAMHGVTSTPASTNVAAASSSTLGGQTIAPQSRDDQGNAQNQYGNGNQGYGFGSGGGNQAPIARSGTS